MTMITENEAVIYSITALCGLLVGFAVGDLFYQMAKYCRRLRRKIKQDHHFNVSPLCPQHHQALYESLDPQGNKDGTELFI
jgi:hypothetical protein